MATIVHMHLLPCAAVGGLIGVIVGAVVVSLLLRVRHERHLSDGYRYLSLVSGERSIDGTDINIAFNPAFAEHRAQRIATKERRRAAALDGRAYPPAGSKAA